jgi:hypothetical protein
VIDAYHEGDMEHGQVGNHYSEITGDVTTTVTSGTATVEESIAGGAVSKTITGASEDTLEKTITGDITETITSAGNIAITVTAAAEYSRMVTAPTAKETITGNWDCIKSAENQTILGICSDNYFGMKSSFLGGIVQESFGGIKIATHSGLSIENKNKGIMGKTEMSITEAKSAAIAKAKLYMNQAKMVLLG